MISMRAFGRADHVFRHARSWSLLRSSPVAVVLLGVFITGAVLRSPMPLLLLPPAVIVLLRQLVRHYGEHISLFGYSIGISQGIVITHTITFPLWRIHFELDQSWIGRIFNFGSIRIQSEGTWYQCAGVANFSVLQEEMRSRQSELAMTNQILIQQINAAPTALRRVK